MVLNSIKRNAGANDLPWQTRDGLLVPPDLNVPRRAHLDLPGLLHVVSNGFTLEINPAGRRLTDTLHHLYERWAQFRADNYEQWVRRNVAAGGAAMAPNDAWWHP